MTDINTQKSAEDMLVSDSKSEMDVVHLGQVFTPQDIVEKMIGMMKNKGSVLEPSCGDGAFSKKLPGCTAIELDETKAPEDAIVMDFFDYPTDNKFDTIIGNPPYVRMQDITDDTRVKLMPYMPEFDGRSNLYLFFIYKCIEHLKEHGELIFIVPRDFLKATSAIKLNKFIYRSGTITDLIDLGDKLIFADASPNCVIFRFEKDDFTRKTNGNLNFIETNGQLLFTEKDYPVSFSDLFFVKVGAVSGADKYFISENGNLDFVCSTTAKDGKTRRMYYNTPAKELEEHKEELLKRKLKHFTEENWYMYGRNYYVSDKERLYVNGKTRNEKPFFYHPCKAYDGSVLAIFPKFETDSDMMKQLVEDFNAVDWKELGFLCDGRYLFSQKALENIVLPETFKKYVK